MYLGAIVLDSDNAEELAAFYHKLLGWTKECQNFEGEKWFIVKSSLKKSTSLVFQQVDNYEKPTWPASKGLQQQMLHIDFYVEHADFERKIQHALACGATLAETQFTANWKVLLDPAGHPFCIIPLPK